MRIPSYLPRLITGALLAGSGLASAAPIVNGMTLTWPDDGWYQVQNADTYESLCQGGLSCDVPAGRYIVINHTTGIRYEDILVNEGQSGSAPMVSGNTITWPDDGWYQVQNADNYESLCEGGLSCEVPAGLYTVINLTTGQRFERLEVLSGGDSNPSGSDGVYPASINVDTTTTPVLDKLNWSFNGEAVTGAYVADADGDGLRDFVFMTSSADAAPCETQVVVLSSLADSKALTSDDLPDTLQMSSTLFSDKEFDGNGCFNIDSVANARDINGDGLEDLSVFMDPDQTPNDESFNKSSAVVFGSRTGSAHDVASLDGQNGFLITATKTPIDGIGDINGDGYGEYSFQNSGFFKFSEVHLLAGNATLPARRVAYDILDEPSLAIFESNTRLSPLGDVNADGLADFQSSNYPHGAKLHLGSLTSDIISQSSNHQSIQAIGDHDNDGLDDFLVSKLTSGCGFNGQISAIVYGSTDNDYLTSDLPIANFGLPGQTRLLSTSGNICGLLGAQALGDLNGDGADDVKIGATVLFGTSGRREPLVSADDLDGSNGFRLASGSYYMDYGSADVDADGYNDIVINGDSVIHGMPTVAPEVSGPQQIVVQMRQGEWTLHWQSPGSEAVAYSLSFNGYELARVSNTTTAILSDPELDEGGLLRVAALDNRGKELGSNIRQVPAYEEFGELSANVYGPKAVELPFNGDTRYVTGLYFLVWRNGDLIDQTSPSGVRSYFDSGVQPGQIYRYFIQPDYLLGDNFDQEHLSSWPLLQRASRVVEAWTPLEGVQIPPSGSGVLITDGNTLYWPDDGRYVVMNTADGSIVCDGGLACEVSNGTYDVINSSTGETWAGIAINQSGSDGVSDGIVPSTPGNVTLDIYSARVAELFWDRPPASERVIRTEIYRDGEFLGTSRGDSYYDGTRQRNTAHWYELIAVDADGDRSTAGTLNVQRALQTLLPANPSSSYTFDVETAFDGNTAVIASTSYLYSSITLLERDSDSGLWTVTQQLDGSSDWNSGTVYRSQVEVSGNTLTVVGQEVSDGVFSDAQLFIFTRDAAGFWQETQRISEPYYGDDNVAIDGDTLALRRETGVEIFTRDANSDSWSSTQQIALADDGDYSDHDLVLVGEQLAISDSGHVENGVQTGAVHLYRRSADGVFSLEQLLLPDSNSPLRNAGRSVAFDGDTVVVSANDGYIIVFERDRDSNWRQTAALDPVGPEYLAPQLAVDGGRLLAGVAEGAGLVNYSGVVIVFEKQDDGGWMETTRLVGNTGTRRFGSSVSLEGNRALVSGETSAIDNDSNNANVAIGHYFELE